MPPILPNIIQGPAIVQWNGKSYYSKDGIKASFKRETFKVTTDSDGQIDERARLQFTEVAFQPDGQVSNLDKYFPYGVGQIGASIFGSTPKPLVIITRFGGTANTGQTITYPRAAVSSLPKLRLKSNDTLFDQMTFTALGVPTVQPSTAGAWQAISDAVFADTSFDESAIITDTYAASFGSAPYNAMGSLSGFEVEVAMETERIIADDFGLVDLVLKSMTATAKFTPSNLTEAQVYALLANQGTGYIYPGQSITKGNTNLVISGSGNGARTLTVTLNNAGPKQAGFVYSSTRHRLDEVEFTTRRTWTSGVANPLFTIAVA